jgi:ATP-dependent DNA ligase
MESQILYQKTKTSAINTWRVYTIGAQLFTEFGQIGGKLQTTPGTICIATNVGRSNERNPEQQAIFQAEAMVKEQLRLKYSTTIEDASKVRVQVMLAQDGHGVKLPPKFDVQRKFDGGRTFTINGDRVLQSRGNKTYNVAHITEELKKMFPADVMTDGELYLHGVPLQKIMSWIKKPQLQTNDIEYHIYDIPSDKPWIERRAILNSYKFSAHVKIVETYTVNSTEELVKLHDQFVEEGFEGAIIRLEGQHGYEFGKRSSSLLKWKNFEDSEFLIVGIEVGKGKYSECPIFVCKNDINDKTFNVVPIGTMEIKKELLNPSNIGKSLTVKFLGRSEDGIPKIAVGKCIRDKKDMPQKEE